MLISKKRKMEKKNNKVEELPIEEFDNDTQDVRDEFNKKFSNKSNDITKSLDVLISAFEQGVLNYDEIEKAHKYIRKVPDGKGGFNYIYEESKDSVKTEGKESVVTIESLEKKKTELLKTAEDLSKLKKKLYSNKDIESPKSQDEKDLDKNVADAYSEINSIVLQKKELAKKEKLDDTIKSTEIFNKAIVTIALAKIEGILPEEIEAKVKEKISSRNNN